MHVNYTEMKNSKLLIIGFSGCWLHGRLLHLTLTMKLEFLTESEQERQCTDLSGFIWQYTSIKYLYNV